MQIYTIFSTPSSTTQYLIRIAIWTVQATSQKFINLPRSACSDQDAFLITLMSTSFPVRTGNEVLYAMSWSVEDFRDISVPLQDMDCHILCAGSLLCFIRLTWFWISLCDQHGGIECATLSGSNVYLFVPPSHEDEVSPEPAHFHMRWELVWKWAGLWDWKLQLFSSNFKLVLRGQTLFRTEGKGQGHVLNHELEHSRNQNHGYRKVVSLTLAIAIADVMTGFTWLIKFLGDKLLYGHVPDPVPRCGTGSGHARLTIGSVP